MSNDLAPTPPPPPGKRPGLAAAAVLGAGILAAFWPILARSGSVLYDRSDSVLNTWILSWQAHILVRQPLDLFAAPIFHPLRASLAFSEIIWPAAPLAVPLLAASGNPVLVYNALYLGTVVLAGLGMFLLARALVANPLAALLAGLIYAFSSHQFGHLSQIQLLSIGWLPLILLALDRFVQRQRPQDGLLLACFVVFQSLSAFYYAFQAALVVGVYLVFYLASALWDRRRRRSRPGQAGAPAAARRGMAGGGMGSRWLRLALWGAVAMAAIAPFTLPYFRVRAQFGLERSLAEALAFSPPLVDYLVPRANNPLYAGLYAAVPGLAGWDAGGLFLGVAATALALLGLATWSGLRPQRPGHAARTPLASRWFWLALFGSAVLLSLGPQLKLLPGDPGGVGLPFQWLFQHAPGFTAMRAPGRFAVSAFLALAALAAVGAGWLLTRLPSRGLRVALTGLLAALIVAEYAGGLAPVRGKAMPDLTAPPPLVAWLAGQPTAVIVELPLTSEMASPPAAAPSPGPAGPVDLARAWPDFNMFRYQYAATAHWQPSADGFTGFVPPHHRELGLAMAGFPSERSLAILRGLGVEYVVVHSQLMEDFQPGRAAGLRQALAAWEGVEPVQDFGPDWVYRVLPGDSPAVAGQLWATAGGDAYLLLTAQAPGTRAFPPTERLRLRATWQPAGGGRATEQALSVALPLAVSEASVLPLALGKPEAAGAYTLTVAAENPPFPLPSFTQQVSVAASGAAPVLLPVRLEEVMVPEEVQQGEAVDVELRWRLVDRPESDVSVAVHVLDSRGEKVVNADQALSGGLDLVRGWEPGMVVTTTHRLALPPAGAGPLAWRVFLYRPDLPVDYLFLDASGMPVQEAVLPLGG